MAEQLDETAQEVHDVLVRAWHHGELTDEDIEWAGDRRSDGVGGNEIVLELLDRAEERRKRKDAED